VREFRNRVAGLADIALPATLGFDYPTPQAIEAMLYAAIVPQPLSKPESVLAELGRLESLLTSLAEADETPAREGGRPPGRAQVPVEHTLEP